MKTTLEPILKEQGNASFRQENEYLKSIDEIMSESDIEKEIAQLLSTVDQKNRLIDKKDAQIEKLKNELLMLRRRLFGHTSERYIKEDPNQLKLDFGGEDILPQEMQALFETSKETINYERKKKEGNTNHPIRQALPAELERREEVIERIPSPKVRNVSERK